MSNSIAEGKLAKFIQYIASTEADIENNRLRLANNPNFDPFQNFRDLDRSEKGYLNERDLSDLLRSFKANVDERDLEPLLTTYKDGIRKITFQDFLRHISPKSDPALKNVFLTRFGVRSGSKSNLDETQRAIANIYKKEADYFREIENLRHSLTNEPKYEEAVYSLADATTGSLSSQSIAKFMSKHHYNFNTSDFDSLIRRLDTNKRGQLTLHELNSFIYPGEFQSNSNYSISHGGNYRYDVQGSLFDSMSTPGRDVNFNPQNIRVNETYIPPSTSFGAYHGLKYSPPKTNPEVIAERIITGTDYRPSAHFATLLEERKPAIEIKRVNIDPIPQPSSVHHVITRSPAITTVHESHYNPKIAAIRDHPLYQMPPPPTHVVTHVEQVRREIPVPERIVANIPAPTRLISQLPLPSHTVTTVENVRREVPERLVSTHVTPSRHLTKEYLRPSYASTNSYTLSATRPSVDTKSAIAGGALKGSTRPYTLLRDNIDLRKSNAYTKTADEKVVSVSPIKRTTNIDTNIGRNYQYITANIPPKYQLSSLQHTSNATATFEKTAVTRENIEQRNSAKAETKPAEENATAQAPTTTTTTQVRPETNVTSSVSRNYSYITPNIPPKYQVSGTSSLETRQPYSRDNQTSSYSRVAPLSSQKPGYSYVDKNAKATELLAQRDTGLRTGSAAQRSDLHYTEKQETYSKTTTAQETAGEAGKPEEIRHSTVLETYKTDNAQRAGSIARPSYVEERAGYGISARPVHDVPVKTEEGDQVTAASSYKFANSKYEQLWGPEPDNE